MSVIRATVPMTQRDAEAAIAAILAGVELHTGQLVRRVDIRSLDVTTMSDAVPQWLRSVSLYLEPIPGSNWITT